MHPLVAVKLELEGVYICVEAALAEELPLLGTDFPELTGLV